MPNTDPPIFSIKQAEKYLEEIESISKKKISPLVALYLTQETPKKEIKEVKHRNKILGYKLYPKNTTTRSSWGIENIKKSYPLLEEMEKKRRSINGSWRSG